MKNKLIMFWAIVLIVIASIITICVKPTKLGLVLTFDKTSEIHSHSFNLIQNHGIPV